MSGFVLLCLEGCAGGLVCGVQGFAYRGPQEPQNEVMQRGAKDGFTESNQLNMAMVRCRMKNPALKFEALQVGTAATPRRGLAYSGEGGLPAIVKQVRQRLQNCPLKTVLGAGYLTAFLERGRVFSGVGQSERPDVVCGKLEEGRVAVLVEGTPSVLLVPFLFVENFQTLDDYLARPFYGTFIRWLKYLAFFLSAFLPGLYVAVVLHHPEMLPESLLLKIAQAQAQTPLPVLPETLLLTFFYEVLREAGLRAPRSLSATVSIVGGLVMGDTAVAAGLVSVPSCWWWPLPRWRATRCLACTSPLPAAVGFFGPGGLLGCGAQWPGWWPCCWICAAAVHGVPCFRRCPHSGRLAWRDVFLRAGWGRLSRGEAPVQDMPGSRDV